MTYSAHPALKQGLLEVPLRRSGLCGHCHFRLTSAMKSTGEAICFIKDLNDPFFRQVYGERSMYLSR